MRKLSFIATLTFIATASLATSVWAQNTAAPAAKPAAAAPAAKPAAAAQPARKDPRDLDGDHRASWDEYRKAMSENFDRLDKNKDSVLESSELPQNPPPKPGQRLPRAEFEKNLRTSFDKLDANKDGYLAGAEFPTAPAATAAKK